MKKKTSINFVKVHNFIKANLVNFKQLAGN